MPESFLGTVGKIHKWPTAVKNHRQFNKSSRKDYVKTERGVYSQYYFSWFFVPRFVGINPTFVIKAYRTVRLCNRPYHSHPWSGQVFIYTYLQKTSSSTPPFPLFGCRHRIRRQFITQVRSCHFLLHGRFVQILGEPAAHRCRRLQSSSEAELSPRAVPAWAQDGISRAADNLRFVDWDLWRPFSLPW